MRKSTQQAEPVERQVLDVLRRTLDVPSPAPDDLSYLKTSLDPGSFSDYASYKRHIVYYSFLRKWKGLNTGIDLEKATFDSWRAAEMQCFRTNRRLESEASASQWGVAPSIILDAQRKIAQILGRVNLKRIATLCGHAGGATFDLKKGSTLGDKVLSTPTITLKCIPVYEAFVPDDDAFGVFQGRDYNIVRSNRCVMVPKNSKIHRMISAEPTLNVFVQQGIGKYIRERLLQFGVNLNDQGINQMLAFRALVDGLTTLDLSMASDTLSTNLVKLLLPMDWFELLDRVRSHRSTYAGRTYLNSKFSSMGNSFTFELESLIFYALCWASAESDQGVVSVYGDDIVCDSRDFARVSETLNWAGFSINAEKSYTTGSLYFESCGKHFFQLEDVTPAYQKDVCKTPADFIRLHNRLFRMGRRLGLVKEVEPALSAVVLEYRKRFSRQPLIHGPVVEDDGHFLVQNFDWRNRDRIKICRLVRVLDLKAVSHTREDAYYSYKLRRPDISMLCPRGYAKEMSDEVHKFRFVNIWRSAEV